MPSKSFRVETIEQLQRDLAALPPCSTEELTRTQAVRKLVPELLAMRSRGYSVAALTRLLAERGVGISAVALRRHLRKGGAGCRVRPAGAKRKPARGRAGGAGESA